ncbi:MAG: hypothetical protein AB1439_03405 [candidate division FCPU426 bacterium]
MEKITNKTKGVHCFTVKLFKDDVEEIISLLSEMSPEVIIEDGENRYSSLEELISTRGITPPKIAIRVYTPYYISLDVSKTNVWLYGSVSDKNAFYAFEKIMAILKRRRILISRILNPIVVGVSYTLLLFLIIIIPVDIIKAWIPNRVVRLCVVLPLFLSSSLSFLLSIFMQMGFFSRLELIKSHESKNFVIRQKDDIIKIIIGAIIGAAITIIVNLFKRP